MTNPKDALVEPAVPRITLSPAAIFAIAVGGALGTVGRFLLDTAFTDSASHFPTTTLIINLSGSLAIGLLVPLVDNSPRLAAPSVPGCRDTRRLDHVFDPRGRRGHFGQGRTRPHGCAFACCDRIRGVDPGDGRQRRWSKNGRHMTGLLAASALSTSHSPTTLVLAFFVAGAGAIGAVVRVLIVHYVALRRTDPLPIGTLIVNVSGSLLLGFLTGLALYHGFGPHDLDVAGIGLCGGYTTWSAASWESVHLLRDGHRSEAILYTFGGLAACLAVAAAGLGLAAIV